MRDNKTLRQEALASLKGRWGSAAVMTVIYLVITGCLSNTLPGISILVLSPLAYGYTIWNLKYFRYRAETPKMTDLFIAFKGNDFLRILGTMLLSSLFIILWTLLFIIPGVIKSMSYAMVPYILADEPNLEYLEVLRRSEEMMKGHKMRLFLMTLNFLMWGILSIFTLGLGLIWVCPYIYATMAAFYEDVKGDNVVIL